MMGEGRPGEPPNRVAHLNRVALSGRLLELGALRYTPAGVAPSSSAGARVGAGRGGSRRQVRAELSAIAFDTQAKADRSGAGNAAAR